MEHLSNRQAIETLENVYELLDPFKNYDERRNIKAIIHQYRTKERLRLSVMSSRTYIPPGI